MAEAAKLSPTTETQDSDARLCSCGEKISSKDTHLICVACLGLEHARTPVDHPGSCPHCSRYTVKSLRRRLARQARLSERDPVLSESATAAPQLGAAAQTDPPALPSQSWSSAMDLLHPLEDEPLLLDYEDNASFGEECQSSPLVTQAKNDSRASQPPLSADLYDVCKRAAERLDIPWPPVAAEAPRSRYEGKKLPQAKRAARQLLPVFQSYLKNKNPILGASSLDFVDMEKLGMARMPYTESMVAAHLHRKLSAMSTRPPTHPSKADRFQSSMAERAYKAAALSVRALNVTSMLTAYQAKLFDDMTQVPNVTAWDDITTVSDLCLRVQRCAIQGVGKCMAMLVLQESARWLNLTNLSDKEREDILDMPVVPEGIFGSALSSMQKRCEAKKREDEALQLCLPCRLSATSPCRSSTGSPVGYTPVAAEESCRASDHSCCCSAASERVTAAAEEEEESVLAVHPAAFEQRRIGSKFPRLRRCQCATEDCPCVPSLSGHGGAMTFSPTSVHAVHAPSIRACTVFPTPRRPFANRGQQRPAATFHPVSEGREVEKLHKIKVGDEDDKQRLQASVRHCPSDIQWFDSESSSGTLSHRFSGGNIVTSGQKGLQIVPSDQKRSGFYSRRYKFRMLTHSTLICLDRPGDWFTSIDLKDAYFHIPIYPPHRKYLREQGIRLATYLDDWLLLAHLHNLRFVVNTAKSIFQPRQSIVFLETVRTFTAHWPVSPRGKRVPYGLCLRLLGLMASVILVVKLGRLYMRGFQLWVHALRLDPVRHRMRTVTITSRCALALRVWKRSGLLTDGVSLGTVSTRKVVTTDACLTGWGGVYEDRPVNGVWSPRLRQAHINYLELKAVVLTLKHFLPHLRGHHVLVRTDNTSTVAHINRQGGLRSTVCLHSHANFCYGAVCISLSESDTRTRSTKYRRRSSLQGQPPLWRVAPESMHGGSDLDQVRRAAVDLFASAENAQCPLFFSLHDRGAPLGVDALSHEWPQMPLYAFPPLALIPPTLHRVREHSLSLILIAQHWPSMPWLQK
ncbi:hypothetical protein WMY93_018584 [Mugilogobius chulae]|uniref:Reverse transcriptase domain-containing protein n=1 Tax=Mugilogobius chulae TaxID=88201 RepID=A0AAW0NUG3_9GOBI